MHTKKKAIKFRMEREKKEQDTEKELEKKTREKTEKKSLHFFKGRSDYRSSPLLFFYLLELPPLQ